MSSPWVFLRRITVTDQSLEFLALKFHNFKSLSLLRCDGFSTDGLADIATHCRGDLEESTKCFQELVLRDQNHPAALINYATLLLSKYGYAVPGAGANAGGSGFVEQTAVVNVAKECLLAVLKA